MFKCLTLCMVTVTFKMMIDERLNFKSNFNIIFKKFSYKVYQFGKIKEYLNSNIRILVYKQTVLPLVEYASFILYMNNKHDVDKLQKLQIGRCYYVILLVLLKSEQMIYMKMPELINWLFVLRLHYYV